MLKSVYSGIFSSVMSYGSHIWVQAQKISLIQNKAIQLINFAPGSHGSHADPLYKRCNIFRLSDIVNL